MPDLVYRYFLRNASMENLKDPYSSILKSKIHQILNSKLTGVNSKIHQILNSKLTGGLAGLGNFVPALRAGGPWKFCTGRTGRAGGPRKFCTGRAGRAGGPRKFCTGPSGRAGGLQIFCTEKPGGAPGLRAWPGPVVGPGCEAPSQFLVVTELRELGFELKRPT